MKSCDELACRYITALDVFSSILINVVNGGANSKFIGTKVCNVVKSDWEKFDKIVQEKNSHTDIDINIDLASNYEDLDGKIEMIELFNKIIENQNRE